MNLYRPYFLDPFFWGIAQPNDIVNLLDSVISDLYVNLDPAKVPTKTLWVCNSRRSNPPTSTPMIIQQATGDIILLNTQDLFWSQYSYQFAHELCHHVIDSNFFTGIDRFGWLEESLCELASIFTLHRMATTWLTNPPYPSWSSYAVELSNYSTTVLNDPQNSISKPLHLWLADNLPTLYTDRVMRVENRIIASKLFPLFIQSPELWQTVQYIKEITVTVDMELNTFLDLWKQQLPPLLQVKFTDVEQLMIGNTVNGTPNNSIGLPTVS